MSRPQRARQRCAAAVVLSIPWLLAGSVALAAEPVATPVPPPASASATPLTIRSKPTGAGVFIDGEFVGRTPWVDFVAPGGHEVTIRAPRRTRFKTVILAAGPAIILEVELPWDPKRFHDRKSKRVRKTVRDDVDDDRDVALRLGGWPNEGGALTASIAVPVVSVAAGIALFVPWGSDFKALGWTLFFQGLVLGPSVGHMYAGFGWETLAHSGLRAAVITVGMGSGYLMLVGFSFGSVVFGVAGAVIFFGAGAALLGSIMFEIVTTAKHARAKRLGTWKRKRKPSRRSRWSFDASPVVATPWGMAPGATFTLSGW